MFINFRLQYTYKSVLSLITYSRYHLKQRFWNWRSQPLWGLLTIFLGFQIHKIVNGTHDYHYDNYSWELKLIKMWNLVYSIKMYNLCRKLLLLSIDLKITEYTSDTLKVFIGVQPVGSRTSGVPMSMILLL